MRKQGIFSFGIGESVGTAKLQEATGCAVSIEGCVIMLCQRGTANISVNFRHYELTKGTLCFASYDMAIRIDSASADFSMLFVTLPMQYVDDVSLKVISAEFWNYVTLRPVLTVSPLHYARLCEWFRQMRWGIEKCGKSQRGIFIGNLFQNLLIGIDSELQLINAYTDNAVNKDSKWVLTSRFCSLVAKHCREQHDVAFYADALAITPGYLYKLVRRLMGTSPKAVIDAQLTTEIKSLLLDTDLSVKSIAAKLHFEDTSYLCRFFHRMTSQSPLEFREGRRDAKEQI